MRDALLDAEVESSLLRLLEKRKIPFISKNDRKVYVTLNSKRHLQRLQLQSVRIAEPRYRIIGKARAIIHNNDDYEDLATREFCNYSPSVSTESLRISKKIYNKKRITSQQLKSSTETNRQSIGLNIPIQIATIDIC